MGFFIILFFVYFDIYAGGCSLVAFRNNNADPTHNMTKNALRTNTPNTPPYIRLASLFSLPIMPTAPFTQIRMNAAVNAKPTADLYTILPTFIAASLYVRPVPNNRTPATMKSATSQTTSLVNCIANKGSSNKNPVASAMRMAALYVVFPVFIISNLAYDVSSR